MFSPVRIMTYNVRYFGHATRGLAATKRPKRGIAAALAGMEHVPDLVCLQEVETISMRSRIAFRKKHKQETQLEAFMGNLEQAFGGGDKTSPYEAFYFRADAYGPKRYPFYTTGLAVLVHRDRWEVVDHNTESPHHITHHHVEAWRDRKQTRICAHMRLRGPRGVLHLFNTHLSLPTPFAREFWREKQKMGFGKNQLREAETLVGFVRAAAGDEPFVVCGDFNSPPGSPVYRFLTGDSGFVGVQEQLGLCNPAVPRGFPTAGLARLRMHLDHIFASPGLRCLDMDGTRPFGDAESPFYGLSDHMPLIGRFEW